MSLSEMRSIICVCERVCRIPLTSHEQTCMNTYSVHRLSGFQERMPIDTDARVRYRNLSHNL